MFKNKVQQKLINNNNNIPPPPPPPPESELACLVRHLSNNS